jgi:hypothetical protein
MAKNGPKGGGRKRSITSRTQFQHPRSGRWIKCDRANDRIIQPPTRSVSQGPPLVTVPRASSLVTGRSPLGEEFRTGNRAGSVRTQFRQELTGFRSHQSLRSTRLAGVIDVRRRGVS